MKKLFFKHSKVLPFTILLQKTNVYALHLLLRPPSLYSICCTSNLILSRGVIFLGCSLGVEFVNRVNSEGERGANIRGRVQQIKKGKKVKE